jgi:ribosomal protein S18 acetylase RimI-like enzyme
MDRVAPAKLVALARECEPFVRPRTESDYWLYGRLFSTTCRAFVSGEDVLAFIVAFRGQDDPSELYIQDVAVAPSQRRRGYGRRLVQDVVDTARQWHVDRIWLTSEAENRGARKAWLSLGFVNPPADYQVDGTWVTAGFKGRGRDRALFELRLA